MIVGERLRTLREERNFSQGEIEKRTGLLRCYISRVENGHTVPAVETWKNSHEPWKCQCINCFTTAKNLPNCPDAVKKQAAGERVWGSSGKDARMFTKLRKLLGKAKEEDTQLLLSIAQKMARKNNG